MRVTVRDIAQACGVSAQSVSFALRGSGRMTDETRSRIQQTARRMGYRPNAIARTMRTGRFNQVGVLGHRHAGPIHYSVIKGVCREMEPHDIGVIVAEVERQSIGEPGKGPKLLRELSSDGLIVDYAHDLPAEVIDAVESAGVPVVWVNANSKHNAVTPDDVGAGRQATRHLIEAGYRQIAFVSGEDAAVHHSVTDRRAGYAEAIRGVCEPNEMLIPHAGAFDAQMDFWFRLFQSTDRPEAVVVHDFQYEPMVAAARMASGASRSKLPIGVAGIAGSDRMPGPLDGLICCVVPWVELGRAAARMLLRRIRSPRKQQPVELIPFQVVGQGVDRPPSR